MYSRQYEIFPGCSVKGKAIVKLFGDGLFYCLPPPALSQKCNIGHKPVNLIFYLTFWGGAEGRILH